MTTMIMFLVELRIETWFFFYVYDILNMKYNNDIKYHQNHVKHFIVFLSIFTFPFLTQFSFYNK